MTKRCTDCGGVKALSEFVVQTKAPDGLANWCRACKAKHRRRRHATHRVSDNAASRAWKQQNAAAVSEYNRRYHADRYANDPAYRRHKITAMVEWQRQNPGAPAAHKRRRSQAGERLRIRDVRAMYAEQHGECFYCDAGLGRKFHVEHKTPLIRGGSHSRDNICLSCSTCNLRKGTKTAAEFRAAREA